MNTPYLIGENDVVAVHVAGQRAVGYRVEATYRSTARLMRQAEMPAWVREIEATEFPEYGKAVAAAKRVLQADIR